MSEKLPWGLKFEGLAPSSMKNITESKLRAFNVGTMNTKKGMSKKEQEEMRKKKEEEETQAAYRDFVESFSNVDKGLNRTWVRGGLSQEAQKKEIKPEPKSRIYKPKSKMAELASTFQSVQQIKKEEDDAEKKRQYSLKKKLQDKKKSNLELFKEELKSVQEERLERRRMKEQLGITPDIASTPKRSSRFEPVESVATGVSMGIVEEYGKGSYNYDNDIQTTNLYLGNINPKMTEQQLCEIFGKFGPLASVKIMWPRSEEERQRGRNCGFVAFMNRKDGERAMNNLQGQDVMTFEMKLGWGKAVPMPPHPVYIPPVMAELTLPPPPSGLPFNAQPKHSRSHQQSSEKDYGNVPPPGMSDDSSTGDSKPEEDPDKTLANAVVKVVIPTERNMLSLIHRMIEFVVREGPMFEAMIMNREISNPMYRFLFENQSPAHVYYRWKMFTILQGDSPYSWKTEEFQMFKYGSLWRPPPMNPYSQGMPEELVHKKSESIKKGQLTESQRDRFEDMLRELIPERIKVGDTMVWCLEHAEAAEEIVECIAESLSILQTPIPKKIARLFLINDILFNCSAKVPNASFYRKYFESKLPEIFKDVHAAYDKIDARLKAEQFKQKVMTCFRAWEDWAVYTNDFLISLQNIFLGLIQSKVLPEVDMDGAVLEEADVDGLPIEDMDGMPFDLLQVPRRPSSEDVDGKPLDDAEVLPIPESIEDKSGHFESGETSVTDSAISEKKSEKPKGFKYEPSKWESVDESLLEAQAVTTSKWDLLEQEASNENLDGEDIDGQPMEEEDLPRSHGGHSQEGSPSRNDSQESSPHRAETSYAQREMTEERRAKLREIELKVMKYQDDLESGRRNRKSGLTIQEQTGHYRKKLLNKEEEREQEEMRDSRRKEYRDKVKEWERAREKEQDYERSRDSRDYERGRDRETPVSLVPYEYEDSRRVRDSGDRLLISKTNDRRDRSPSDEEYTEPSSYRVFVSRSTSQSPTRMVKRGRSRSATPPSAYREEPTPPSAKRRPRSRSRERRRHRSRSPKKSSRSQTGSPRKSKRSRSRSYSPGRHRHKHKKSRH